MNATATKIEVENVVRLLRSPYNGTWLVTRKLKGNRLRLLKLGSACATTLQVITVAASAVIPD